MTDQLKFAPLVLSSMLVIAALTVGTVAPSDAQTLEQPYRATSQTPGAPPPEQQELQNLPAAMRDRVAESLVPCGGDFGMLGNLAIARGGPPPGVASQPDRRPGLRLNGCHGTGRGAEEILLPRRLTRADDSDKGMGGAVPRPAIEATSGFRALTRAPLIRSVSPPEIVT
jgi:hypothetical protein